MDMLDNYIRTLKYVSDENITSLAFAFDMRCVRLAKEGNDFDEIEKKKGEFYELATEKGWCGFE